MTVSQLRAALAPCLNNATVFVDGRRLQSLQVKETDAGPIIWLESDGGPIHRVCVCGKLMEVSGPGCRKYREYCSNACKQRAYRARLAAGEQEKR